MYTYTPSSQYVNIFGYTEVHKKAAFHEVTFGNSYREELSLATYWLPSPCEDDMSFWYLSLVVCCLLCNTGLTVAPLRALCIGRR